ncbi:MULTISPECIES: DUF485 domain-containing protein [unclassified Xanthobacter]|uniref:DUF485 domain-containing protein n=1 Tax=unclassified Xanthobacter TaxID=2623496 RepID=UPI001EE0FC28|nr:MULTISPECIES: DUF485 domain-containing protein [unclassified Xanthobacter]
MTLQPHPPHPSSGGSGRLGLAATAILAGVYLTFTALGAFAPQLLAAPIQPGGIFTWAFALGLGVIGLGFVLTVIYAVIANRRESVALAARALVPAEGGAR